MSRRELPVNRLSTTDATGARVYIHPADVKGRFRNRRLALSILLIALFLYLPWIKIGGNPAILLDVAHRKFSILGVLFWAHDAPMLIFVFGAIALLLFFVTVVWGRVWCGWACPQTVFIDHVYRRIERWIEGDSIDRKRLSEAPLSLDKFKKRFFKWTLFLGVSLVLSHSFLAYFISVEDLGLMMSHSPLEHPAAFLLMTGMTGFLLFNFGWFREQFCTIACPYGRFQSVIMDGSSMVVGYDQGRGEPRRGQLPQDGLLSDQPTGDCVNCYRCVRVCPTGIDIRRGVQMECIACTACMDACDEVMTKLKKPKGLIRYTSADFVSQSKKQESRFQSKLGARAWIYLGVLSLVFAGAFFRIQTRKPAEVVFVRAVGALYQELPATSENSKEIVNHYKVDVQSQSFDTVTLELSLPETVIQRGIHLSTQTTQLSLKPGQQERFSVFIRYPESLLNERGRAETQVEVKVRRSGATQALSEEVTSWTEEVALIGPLQ